MEIAATIMKVVGPFVPWLIGKAEAAGQAFVDAVAERGGTAAWDAAKKLWAKCASLVTGDSAVEGAIGLVENNAEEPAFHTALEAALKQHFAAHPEHAKELAETLKEPGIRQIVEAEGEASIENVYQDGQGVHGEQRVTGKDKARIKGVKQNIRES